ncbi:MAG TPA: GNAT family N-acetyltransferase [Gaiellaceae bacterium]|nr:GNAT family N-acetyltransferase [Gaiellaceae bacterium]
MELRPAAAADAASLHDVFTSAIGELYGRHGFAAPAVPRPVFELLQEHVRATGTSVVADAGGDRIAGFASAWSRGDDWFLASLFVAPAAQGHGLGSALLDAVWGDGFARRRTITDAIQPVSNALYGRRGLVPVTPILDFAGEPRRGGPLLEAGSGDPAAIDAAAYGFDRAPDHALWERAAPRTLWRQAGEPVAYSYRLGSTIGPLAGIDPEAAAAALDSELRRAEEPVRVRIPGSCRCLAAVALAHRLRLSPTPGLLLLSEGVQPPDALAIAGYALF